MGLIIVKDAHKLRFLNYCVSLSVRCTYSSWSVYTRFEAVRRLGYSTIEVIRFIDDQIVRTH